MKNNNVLISFFTSIMLVLVFISPTPIMTYRSQAENLEVLAPAYARWGQLAMKETKSKYPKADIVDYLHIGRTSTPLVTTEQFKLWLREANREFGVLIKFKFETKTEKIISIQIKETF